MIEKQRLIAKHRQEDLWAGMLLQSSEKNTDIHLWAIPSVVLPSELNEKRKNTQLQAERNNLLSVGLFDARKNSHASGSKDSSHTQSDKF